MSSGSDKVRPVARLGAHEGRLTGGYADESLAYAYKARVEKLKHLFPPVMTYNKAHVVMLTEQGIVTREIGRKLLAALQEIEELGIDRIELDPTLEGIYPITEALVIDKTGYNVGGMLYLGRTRGDVHKVPDRMTHREWVLKIMTEVNGIRNGALRLAAEHLETLMPSYTHLQHAQPMTFGYYMLWIAEALETDFERLTHLYQRLNKCSAEVGAGMTTSFPMNRERVAELLGFEGVIENALFAHRSMDREVETVFTLSLVSLDLYRLCEDFLIWCSSDVNFMELDDRHSATSFLMAQKKNPAGLHHGETAAIVAHSTSLAIYEIAMRNTSEMTLWGNRAMISMQDALENVHGAARLLNGLVPAVILHRDVMLDSVGKRFAQATDLTDALVRDAGLSFREAHRVVGVLVRTALERSIPPSQVTAEMLQAAGEEAIGKPVTLGEAVFERAMDPMEGVRSKKVLGGPAPELVRDAIQRKRNALAADDNWLADKRSGLQEADRKLGAACEAILASS